MPQPWRFALLACTLCACTDRRSTSPNVLLLTLDTTRADRLGCYGYAPAQTPALDRLAREGVMCTQAVSVAPITQPAHASMMTGLLPPAHGLRDNGATVLSEQASTLAERLQQAGYRTAAFVSSAVLDHRYNLNQGFATYDDDMGNGQQVSSLMYRKRPADDTAGRVLQWLHSWTRSQPFFVWAHFFDPHYPYQHRSNSTPPSYDTEISAMDAGIERIIAHLRTTQDLDNTLVVVMADHGEGLGDHAEKTHSVFVYDTTTRVPMIWRYPRLLRPRVHPDVIRTVDLAPTVLAAMGLPAWRHVDGENLLEALQGRAAPPLPAYSESLVSAHGFGMAPLYAVRLDGYKYIRAPRPELYDIRADPQELVNLVERDPERAERLDGRLQELMRGSEAHAITPNAAHVDSETLESLAALGYVAPTEMRTAMQGMDPKDGIGLYTQLEAARRAAQAKAWPRCAQLAERVVQALPRNTAALDLLASALMHQNKVHEAKRVYEQWLAADPRQYRVHIMLGRLAYERGDFPQAQTHFHDTLALMPNSADALGYLGLLRERAGDTPGAESLWQQARQVRPQFDQFFTRLGLRAWDAHQVPAAAHLLAHALRNLPDDFTTLLHAGMCDIQLGQVPAAVQHLQHAALIRPADPLPFYHLARAWVRRGDTVAAMESLTTAADLGFADVDLLQRDVDLRRLASVPEFFTLKLRFWNNMTQAPGPQA